MVLNDELRATHEASHAVTKFSFGIPVSELAINETGGYCASPDRWEQSFNFRDLAKQEALMQRAIVSCSGRYGMKLLRGSKPDCGWKVSDDRRQALEACMKYCDGDEISASHLLSYAMRQAELLIAKNTEKIQRLTLALIDRTKLSGAEIAQLLNGAKAA